QLADLVLPVLPEGEGGHEQDTGDDEEGDPGPAPGAPGVTIREGPPDPRGEHPQPVADGGRDPPDQALHDPAPRDQRRAEPKTREGGGGGAAREGDIQQLPAFTGLRRLRAFGRRHGRRGSGGRRARRVQRHGYLLFDDRPAVITG